MPARSLSLTHRLNTAVPIYLQGGYTNGGGTEHVGRAAASVVSVPALRCARDTQTSGRRRTGIPVSQMCNEPQNTSITFHYIVRSLPLSFARRAVAGLSCHSGHR
jgi:hypothetical protein